jgi:acetyl esterase/lipase
MYRSDPPFHETYDPIQLIDATHPPCFIVVATADTLVETAHSYNFHRKLLESGVVVELAEARNMEHGKSENNDSTEEASKAYAGWWEEAIKPGLDFVVQKMRA